MKQLRVPYGIDATGGEVRPETCVAATKVVCPDCGGPLLLRSGQQRRAHFAHRVTPQRGGCDFWTETEAHLRAKKLVAAAVEARHQIDLIRRCHECGRDAAQPLQSEIVHAQLEYRLSNGLRADVALFDDAARLRAIIEICASHECEPEKVAALSAVPWAEFDASEILSKAFRWRARSDHLEPFRCDRCRMGKWRLFEGEGLLNIACPLQGGHQVRAAESCAPCAFFDGVRPGAVHCHAGST